MITALGKKGRPTELVHTLLRAPQSRMDILTTDEIEQIVKRSRIAEHYNKNINRESAYEILTSKLEKAALRTESTNRIVAKPKKSEKSTIEAVLGSTAARQIGRTIARELTRGLLGVLGIKRRR